MPHLWCNYHQQTQRGPLHFTKRRSKQYHFGKNLKTPWKKTVFFRKNCVWSIAWRREREEWIKGSQVKCLLRKIQWLSMEEDFHRCRWKKTTCGKFESVKVRKKGRFQNETGVIDWMEEKKSQVKYLLMKISIKRKHFCCRCKILATFFRLVESNTVFFKTILVWSIEWKRRRSVK